MIAYVGKEAVSVVLFPPFTGHDEVAHYAYLRTVETEHRIPVLNKDRLPPELYRYCYYTLGWVPCYPSDEGYRANPPQVAIYEDGNIYPVGMQYAANHPPLYYLLMTPFYWAIKGQSPAFQVYVLRALTIPFGVLTVLLALLLVREIFPYDKFMLITVPAFVAWQPQVSYEAAMLNNDMLSISLCSLILYELVYGLRRGFSPRLSLCIGGTLGLALLAKSTASTMTVIIAAALVIGCGVRQYRAWIGRGALVAAVAGLLVAPWCAYLYQTYGNLSGLPQLASLQRSWNKPEGSFFNLLFSADFVGHRWQETWGEFGWRLIELSNTFLIILAVPAAIALIGLVIYPFYSRINREPRRSEIASDSVLLLAPWQAWSIALMAFTFLVAYLAIVQFGTRFSLTQARYYFPAINALALLLMLGLRTVIPEKRLALGQAGVVTGLIVVNLIIYSVYVIPYWHLPA